MEGRIILFKLFLIKRNIYEKFIKAYHYTHLDGDFENFLLTHVEECYSDLVVHAFPWGSVNKLYIDALIEINIEWAIKSKLINNMLKNDY